MTDDQSQLPDSETKPREELEKMNKSELVEEVLAAYDQYSALGQAYAKMTERVQFLLIQKDANEEFMANVLKRMRD